MEIQLVEYTTIKVKGKRIRAAAPVIISASRATDIPAFGGEWLSERLKDGYVQKTNPFSGKPYYISFKNAAVFVFWTKDPEPFRSFLEKFNYPFYFHFTLNNYDGLDIEPGVPSVESRICTFKELANHFGKERILWRFDPLMRFPGMTVDDLLERIEKTAKQLVGYTERLTFSFLTLKGYTAAQKRLNTVLKPYGLSSNDLLHNSEEKKRVLHFLAELQQTWKKTDSAFAVKSCAMPENYSPYEISPARCIDDTLLARVFGDNASIQKLLGQTTNLFSSEISLPDDPTQRKHCHCIESKDIGLYNTCNHGCLYCYANKKSNQIG
ncbi:MAG: DUF1848 domain-containing protein [Salinivirgaceae bacterium]